MSTNVKCKQEYDFGLIVGGIHELTAEVENALFEAGCDDATPSIQYGQLYLDFSRSAESLEEAVLSAIRDVRQANIGACVLRVDECNLVTQSEIARRIKRSRQLVSQFISGKRGPGNFPPPEYYLTDGVPLWPWCAVSYWLAENDILRPEDGWNATAIAMINNRLELEQLQHKNPKLASEIKAALAAK